jgi:hypothetical protein
MQRVLCSKKEASSCEFIRNMLKVGRNLSVFFNKIELFFHTKFGSKPSFTLNEGFFVLP